MNNISLWIYLMGIVDKVNGPVGFAAFTSAFVFAAATFFSVCPPPCSDKEDRSMFFKAWVVSGIAALVLGFLYVLTPDSKTITAMLVVPAIVENQRIQNLGDDSLKLIEGKMKAWLDEQTKAEARK